METPPTAPAEESDPKPSAPLLLLFGMVVVWGATFVVLPQLAGEGFPSNAGQIGDMFGVVTSLFTALGFVGIYWTLRLQSWQIREAERRRRIDEIERSKELAELSRQSSAAMEQLAIERERQKDSIEPVFGFSVGSNNPGRATYRVVNFGAPVLHLNVVPRTKAAGFSADVIRGRGITFGIEYVSEILLIYPPDTFIFEFTIKYDLGKTGGAGEQTFQVPTPDAGTLPFRRPFLKV